MNTCAHFRAYEMVENSPFQLPIPVTMAHTSIIDNEDRGVFIMISNLFDGHVYMFCLANSTVPIGKHFDSCTRAMFHISQSTGS